MPLQPRGGGSNHTPPWEGSAGRMGMGMGMGMGMDMGMGKAIVLAVVVTM